MGSVETTARKANAPESWDTLWEREGLDTWRKEMLAQVYTRIERLMPHGAHVVDIGGGLGILAERLARTRGCHVEVWDISPAAVAACRARGIAARLCDLELPSIEDTTGSGALLPIAPHSVTPGTVIVATEVCEHLSEIARARLFALAKHAGRAFISVPNDCLGPDEEPQHTIRWTAVEFLRTLRQACGVARVEPLGPEFRYNLGVIGFPKGFTLSVTFPARDEAHDIAKTLASFRGVADEMIIGIDPRTIDDTRAIAERYADEVFTLDTPRGPDGAEVEAADGVHFAHIRNQCIERCHGDWIFMTEAHEWLATGHDVLLALDRVTAGAMVGFVWRSGVTQSKRIGGLELMERWRYPWLFRRDTRIRFERAVHNELAFPASMLCIKLPQVRTVHDRHADRIMSRDKQRKAQNRTYLMEDWIERGNEGSLFYLAQEWRAMDPPRAIDYLTQLLARPAKNGPMRYQARLTLAKMLAAKGDKTGARRVLLDCVHEDWSRTDHWLWLGDLAFEAERYEEALQWYRYAATTSGEPPDAVWWYDDVNYTCLPAQRLAMTYAALGRAEDALTWAERAREFLPEDAPHEAFAEADENIALLRDAVRPMEAQAQ